MARVLVAGAGIAGLGAAILLRRAGFECEVHASSERAGGLLEPVVFQGVSCDRGSHRVHRDADPLLFELARDVAWERRPRRGVLLLGGRRLPYPPEPLAFLRALGARAAGEMAAGWLARPRGWERARGAEGHDEGFEDFVRARAGDVAYERFYRPYAEKVWGLDPRALSRTVARQRVSTSAPWGALLRSLGGARDDAFLYPRGGVGAVVDALAAACARLGVVVRWGTPVTRASLAARPFDAAVYTGHLDALTPEHPLPHRGLYLVHLALPPGTLDATDTWYAPESRYWFGRASQPARFSASLASARCDVLAVEIPEGRWGPAQDFVARLDVLEAQLRDAGIVPPGARALEASQTFVPRVYPLYERGWVARWRAALASVRALGNVYPAGRQGLYLHCNMDHALRTAADAVGHLARGASAGAWIDGCERYLALRVRD